MTKARSDIIGSINNIFDNRFSLLESQVRDCSTPNNVGHNEIENIKLKLHRYVHSELNSVTIALMNDTRAQFEVFKENIKNELQSIKNELVKKNDVPLVCSPSISNNLVVERKDESSIMMCEEEEAEVESEVEIEEEEEAEPQNKFSLVERNNKKYWVDENLVVYKETEEGYEEIGTYNTETGDLDIENEEKEEEAVETVEFTYKCVTYYRDQENTVYDEDGEEIGLWTGSVVKFSLKR
jgi:hypothetical protein